MKKTLLLLLAATAFVLAGCKGEPNPPAPDPGPGPVDPEPEPDAPGIYTVEDFLAFAAAVNAGESIQEWENEEGWVNLRADLDFTGVETWTPVGNAVAPWGSSYNPVVTEGHAFTGKFEGNAHHIKNLVLVDNGTEVGAHFGLFGYLGKGAIVQNFVIDNTCSLTVNSSASHSAGMIAGVLYDASVRDVTSYAPMTYKGAATGLMHMALIGGIYANEEDCIVDSVHNNGKITATNTANLNAGATGIHAAGIVGFTNANTDGGKTITVSSCNNYGEMESQAGRTAGIVGAANASTQIIGCENRGNQLNTMPKDDGGRLGNIVCFTNNGSTITSCKNYGNLISTRSGRVGGIVSLANPGTYSNNENYGEIISDSQFRGVFFGYINTVTTWKGGKASGKVGKYNGGTYIYDLYEDAQKENYLGPVGGSGAINATDIVYDIATGETPVNPDPELDIEAGLRIFFIGNSFTKDAVELLPNLLHEKGLTDVQLVHMYYGGRTVPEYVSGWSSATDYHCYVCNPGQTGWTDLSGKSLAAVAATGKWDFVTIQEHTGREIAWGKTDADKAAEVQAVKDLVAKVKAAQTANGAAPKLYYILSQAYHNLAKAQNVEKNFTNTDEMWTVISAVGKAIVEGASFDGIISTGAMLQNLRTSGLNNANGLTRDGYHMDYGIARFGAACTVYETLLAAAKGALPDDIVCGPSADSFSGDSWTTAVTAKRAPVALHAARYAIQKPYEVTDMEGEGKEEPADPGEVEKVSIGTADELVAFAARVNSGDEAAQKANVSLTADIDCSSITSWTPIGSGTMSSWSHVNLTISGPVFSGTFDGQGHSIKNLAMSFASSGSYAAYGFFGILGDKAIVKDLTFASSCSMNVSVAYGSSFGVLAGLAKGATISNISNYAALTGGGTASLGDNNAAGRTMVGAIIGEIHAEAVEAKLTNLHNYADIGSASADFSRGGNSGNGANGFEVGGIAGFSTTTNTTGILVTFTNCVNDGNLYSNAGRCSGIVAGCNRYTKLENCTNNGNITSSVSGTYRLGNITCIAGEGSVLDGCVNKGNLTALNCVSVAGVVCLVNHATVQIKNCASLGATILGKSVNISGDQTYNGVLFGLCNNAATFSGCSINGYFGTSDSNKVALTAENYFQFAGQRGANCSATCNTTNITFAE